MCARRLQCVHTVSTRYPKIHESKFDIIRLRRETTKHRWKHALVLVATWMQPLSNEGEHTLYPCERFCNHLQCLCVYFLISTLYLWQNKPLVEEEIQLSHLTSNQCSHRHYESTVHPFNNTTQTCDSAQKIHTTHRIVTSIVECAPTKYWRFQLDFHFP